MESNSLASRRKITRDVECVVSTLKFDELGWAHGPGPRSLHLELDTFETNQLKR